MNTIPIKNSDDIKWFESKRNQQLERFVDLIKTQAETERIDRCYKNLMKFQEQLTLIEQVTIITNIFSNDERRIN